MTLRALISGDSGADAAKDFHWGGGSTTGSKAAMKVIQAEDKSQKTTGSSQLTEVATLG